MKSLLVSFSALLAVTNLPVTASAQYVPPPAQPIAGPEAVDEPYAVEPEAYAQQQPMQAFNYYGPHPIPYDQGGGFCQYSGPHQHPYPAFDHHLFRLVGGYAYFIGDPVDFGYQGTTYVYQGNHPIDPAYGGGYCYMGWPHRHLFAPVGQEYVFQDGVYAYVGVWGSDYYVQRPLYVNYFDGYYRRNYFGGRYFALRPPPIYLNWGWHHPFYQPWNRPYNYGGPVYRPPVPVYRAPAYGGPVYRPPVYHGPTYGGPVYRPPVYHGPTYGGPVYRPPVNNGPAYGGPAYHPPAMHAAPPAMRAPAFAAPHAVHPAVPAHFGRR